jgi:guanylate kinase
MRPLIISGPSGIGKNYLVNILTNEYDYKNIIPVTTREPRTGEIDGESYYFVTPEKYTEMEKNGEFFMSNKFLNAQYGTQKVEITKIMEKGLRPVMIVYTPTTEQFLQAFPDSDAIFILPKNLDLIKERMRTRGDTPEKVDFRMQGAIDEIKYFKEKAQKYYHRTYVIENNDLTEILKGIEDLRKTNDK